MPFALIGVVLFAVTLNRLHERLLNELATRIETELQLTESKELFSGTLDFIPEPIAIFDADTSVFLDLNQKWLETFEFEKNEVIGKTTLQLQILTEQKTNEIRQMRIANGGIINAFVAQARTRSGREIWCELSCKVINNRDTRLAIWAVRDITEARSNQIKIMELNENLEQIVAHRTEQLEARNAQLDEAVSLLESAKLDLTDTETRLSSVLIATGEGTWDWDITSGSVKNNERWCEIFGFVTGALQRDVSEFAEMMFPEDREVVFSLLENSIITGEIYRHEHRMKHRDGATLWVQDRGIVCQRDDTGKAIRMVGSVTDITNRKLAEIAITEARARAESTNHTLLQAMDDLRRAQERLVQSEKLAALGGLVAGVAHELNTPLGNSLMASSTLIEHTNSITAAKLNGTLKRSELNAYLNQCAEASELIQRNSLRAAQLITSFKQVAIDQTTMSVRKCLLDQVLNDALASIRPTYANKKITLALDVAAGIELDTYPGTIEQVIVNLIQNCALHAPKSDQHLNIWITAESRSDAAQVQLSVTDDGAGMSEEVRSRAFDPFFTTKFGQGGSGLGLYLVYNMVTSVLQGDVILKSIPDSGTTVLISFPSRIEVRETDDLASNVA